MKSKTLMIACQWAFVLAAALFTTSSQAHECRILGQSNNFTPPPYPGSYYVCVGFSIEDASLGQPGEGKKNNLDLFPLFVTGPDEADYIPLDTRKGDKVDIKATLYYLNDKYFEIPTDADFNVTVPLFFFKTPGVGYESPIATCSPWQSGCKEFKKALTNLVPVDVPEEDAVSYRAPNNFVLPYSGMYAWVITGTLQKKGQKPVEINAKWVSGAPRVPYGPLDADDIKKSTLVDGPEGWFENVQPAAHAHSAIVARAAAKPARGSPDFRKVLKRALGGG